MNDRWKDRQTDRQKTKIDKEGLNTNRQTIDRDSWKTNRQKTGRDGR